MHQLALLKLKMTAIAMLVYQDGDLARLTMMLHDATLKEKEILTHYYHEIIKHSQQACLH